MNFELIAAEGRNRLVLIPETDEEAAVLEAAHDAQDGDSFAVIFTGLSGHWAGGDRAAIAQVGDADDEETRRRERAEIEAFIAGRSAAGREASLG